MKSLFLEPSEGHFATPQVSFDLDTMIFEISGESYIENTDAFYDPIVGWLDEFTDKYDDKIIFNFKFLYYNSSSAKSILKMFKILKKYQDARHDVEINWYYPEGNEDLEQEGKDFKELLNLSMRFYVILS